MPPSTRRAGGKQDTTGLIHPMLGFLDRNLNRFSQPVRDTIGIGVLLILIIYVLNGLIGSTYIRGKMFVHDPLRTPAAGWRVSLGEFESVTNAKGWWTLPLPGSGIPGRIKLEIADAGKEADGRSREPLWVGEVFAFGPWPFWNTLKPMNDLVVDVYPDRPPDQRVRLASLEFFSLPTAYAQPNISAQQNRRATIDRPSCALSLTRVRVNRFPGFFRSSGRAYLQMYLDGKVVDGQKLLYGPGIDWKAGQFPVQADKELWLPVRTGSDDRYSGLFADLTDVVDCSLDSAGRVQVQPFGNLQLKVFGDQGDVLSSFDLGPALARANQEIELAGDSKGQASITVEVLAQGIRIIEFSLNGKRLRWKVTGALSDIKIQGMHRHFTFEADVTRAREGTYDISIDGGQFDTYALQVLDAHLNIVAEKWVEVK
jgi:hypothetical protein